MRQAIEEGFILDVLANYTTYKAYWRLLKKIEDDPRYDKKKAEYLLKSFVELHPHAIGEKVRIMVEHFAAQVQNEIGGKAKAMIVTRSRLHAVRYKLAVDQYIAEQGYPFKALVAFSGTVEDGGQSYTEAGMNGFPETQTAKTFERPEYRFLIVANKFQTGFDQPLLHTMYVDKKLGGVNAVQTLSRLNRTHPGKERDDGARLRQRGGGHPDGLRALLRDNAAVRGDRSESALRDPRPPAQFPGLHEADVDASRRSISTRRRPRTSSMRRLRRWSSDSAGYPKRSRQTSGASSRTMCGSMRSWRRCSPSPMRTWKSSMFSRAPAAAAPGGLRGAAPGGPAEYRHGVVPDPADRQREDRPGAQDRTCSIRWAPRLITEPPRRRWNHSPGSSPELNERFGLNLGPEHRVTLGQMMEKLDADAALDASARVNTRENVRLTFEQKVEDVIQEIVDSNFDLYKRITDDRAFGEAVKNFLFDQYLRSHRQAEELHQAAASRRRWSSSPRLRWNLKEDRQDDKVTHAALKTIAAFLNTEGGDLLIGVADDGAVAWHRPRSAGERRQVHAPPGPGCPKRPWRPGQHLHRSPNPGGSGQDHLPRELPPQSGAGVPEVEGYGKAPRGGLLRT